MRSVRSLGMGLEEPQSCTRPFNNVTASSSECEGGRSWGSRQHRGPRRKLDAGASVRKEPPLSEFRVVVLGRQAHASSPSEPPRAVVILSKAELAVLDLKVLGLDIDSVRLAQNSPPSGA